MSYASATRAAIVLVSVGTCYEALRRWRRYKRSRYITEEEETDPSDTMPSIISHFEDVRLDESSTIKEANERRTQSYYQLSRDAHIFDLCLGVFRIEKLRQRRKEEIERSMRYHQSGKSHRTVICMCDDETVSMLDKARKLILAPLQASFDISTQGIWIPSLNWIPAEHLHITVACLWWWHTMRSNNTKLTQDMAARFRQTLISEFHFAFQIELERIVLLGGKTLVALWRCVGERETADGFTIFDRHGEAKDPFIKLRRNIVRCYTSDDFGEPLTYTLKIQKQRNDRKLKRQTSVETKTPGMGNYDGFIHTTLARLPLDCLSNEDVSLEPIHRRCREATATYAGHRMVISKYRFLETTGAGGESNPCVEPIFDETIIAPIKVETCERGNISEMHFVDSNLERSVTIGHVGSLMERVDTGTTPIQDLFVDESTLDE